MTRVTRLLALPVAALCVLAFDFARARPLTASVQSTQAPKQAPQPAPQGTAFRAGVNLMRVDVSVLDKDRQPVRDLKAEDFTLTEDGVPQRIQAVTFVEAPIVDAAASGAKWTKTVSADVSTNDFGESRLFVIVMDDAMAIGDGATITNAKKIAHEVVDHLAPGDRAAVIFTRDNRNTQDFTNDVARLHKAVDKFNAGFVFTVERANLSTGGGPRGGASGTAAGLKPPYPDEYYFRSSASTLTSVTDYLTAIPDRRKVLVYISIGLPVDIGGSDDPTQPQANDGVSPEMGAGSDPERRELLNTLHDEVSRALDKAAKSNVTVYSFDPAGLDGFQIFCSRPMGNHNPCMSANPAPVSAYTNYLRALADDTGGHAYVDRNSYEGGIQQMFDENAAYYLVGFQSTNTKQNGAFRRIAVTVNRPGVIIRSRTGYYSQSAQAEEGLVAAGLTSSIAGLLPDPKTPMRVTTAPFATPDGKSSTVAIVLSLREAPPSARTTETIDLLASAFTPDGVSKNSQTQTAEVTLRPADPGDKDAQARFEVLTRIDLPPGRYSLRLAAHNATRDETGSVFTDVDVPDFTKAPLSLSGALVQSSSAPAAAPRDALATLVPVVPTTERTFGVNDDVNVMLRAYQGGKVAIAPVTVAIQIQDNTDTVVFNKTDTIAAATFTAERTADISFPVPMAGLKPGPHLLTFQATAGKATARRDVVFVVK